MMVLTTAAWNVVKVRLKIDSLIFQFFLYTFTYFHSVKNQIIKYLISLNINLKPNYL